VEWTRVHLESDENSLETIHGFDDLKIGLDTDAESMHQNFLKAVPQLEEIKKRHNQMLSNLESREVRKTVSTLGDFLSEFGGEWSDPLIRMPISIADREGVVLEIGREESTELVRIISPERFGGMMRTFRVPDGKSLVSAIWEDECLILRLG
tara:strand:- start:403 stop:858 length:456 start_codon:yes stop_codon:yes gene_type:complete